MGLLDEGYALREGQRRAFVRRNAGRQRHTGILDVLEQLQ